MLAGQGQTLSVWTQDLLKNLAQGRQTTIFDNRGIGASTDSSEAAYTPSDYVVSTLGLINALELVQPDILGWSLGATISLAVLEVGRSIVGRVVLVGATSTGQGWLTSPASAEAVAELLTITKDGPIPATFLYPDTDLGNAALCRFKLFQQVMPPEHTEAEQFGRQYPVSLASLPGSNAIYEALPNVTNPTLIIAGSNDIVVAIQNGLIIFNRVPGASFLQFQDAGHAVILQHGITCAKEISAFLDDPPA